MSKLTLRSEAYYIDRITELENKVKQMKADKFTARKYVKHMTEDLQNTKATIKQVREVGFSAIQDGLAKWNGLVNTDTERAILKTFREAADCIKELEALLQENQHE